jgi:isohexenylglutaconyl-CoA hydratase
MKGIPSTSAITLRREGCCLHLTLNRPDVRNAINAQMWDEIEAVFSGLKDDRAIKVVVLRGAGGYFCSGADLKERRGLAAGSVGGEGDPLVARSRKAGGLLLQIDQAPQVVVAAVEGGAMGGGFGLVCVSDIAFATAEARFALPEVTLGIPPAQILPYLVRRIGPMQVRRLALTAARFDGTEAARIGVVHEVVQTTAAMDELVASTVKLIEGCGPGAIAASKQLIHRIVSKEAAELVDYSAKLFADCARSDEGKEGAAAFRDKRKPIWGPPA